MKKKIIMSLALNGVSKEFNRSIFSIENYCEKYKIDLRILTQPTINGPHIFFEKFNFVSLLDNYEQVCYMDLDILITPNARNIFEACNEKNFFYAFEENSDLIHMRRDEFVRPLLNYCPDWPLNNLQKYRYFNAGIFVVSHLHKKCFENFINVPNINGIETFGDQTYMNYLITKNKIPFKYLDYSFNRMHLGLPDPENKRLQADIIHYAGQDNKGYRIENDYKLLYETI
jgi:lipopolysaccharide biosynthesis glycosyltransferase